MRGPGVCVAALILASSARAQDSAVQTLLKANCVPCHNDSTKSSGLAMTSRETILAGGNRGVAVKPGNPSESLLLRAVEQSGDLKMPPGRKLSPEQTDVIRKWIADGAVRYRTRKDAVSSANVEAQRRGLVGVSARDASAYRSHRLFPETRLGAQSYRPVHSGASRKRLLNSTTPSLEASRASLAAPR